ncbi:hypothetical protein B0H14DRAFT_3760420 [Mycena olivaceomarginata]|nr:hypothetical protein B0H14DRAFT_3760420 [Mycena olivaceomarginata]
MTRAARDLPHLKKFGVHAIWAYSVDSTLNHDSCMVALSGGGIYSMCVVALFHSFYSADNNHTDILDLTLALNGSIDTTRPIWGTNLPDQYFVATLMASLSLGEDDEEEAAADPACGEAAREELKGAGGAGRRTAVPLAFVPLRFSSFPSFLFTLLPITLTYHDRASDPGRRPCPARAPLPARSRTLLQPAAYGGGGDGEGEYAYARPPALRARGAEQGVRARQGAAAAPSRSSAHLAGCGADADAVPAARMRGGARRGPGAGVRVTVCVCECKGCGRLALASQQRRGVMEVEGGLEGLTCAKLIMCKRAPRDDASRRVETVLEVIAMKERIGPGCCNGCGPLLATVDTTEKVWNTAQKPVKISVHPLPASRPSFSLSYRTIAVVPYLLYCYVADSLETFTQLFSGYHSYCESFHHHNVVLQLGWSDIITAKASISEGMEAGSEQTIGLQRHVIDVSKCTYEATGVIGVYLSGSIWFKYKDYRSGLLAIPDSAGSTVRWERQILDSLIRLTGVLGSTRLGVCVSTTFPLTFGEKLTTLAQAQQIIHKALPVPLAHFGMSSSFRYSYLDIIHQFSAASVPLMSSRPHLESRAGSPLTQPSLYLVHTSDRRRRYTFDSHFSTNLKSEFIFVWGEMDFIEATTSSERRVNENLTEGWVNGLVTIQPSSCEAGTKFAVVLNQRLNLVKKPTYFTGYDSCRLPRVSPKIYPKDISGNKHEDVGGNDAWRKWKPTWPAKRARPGSYYLSQLSSPTGTTDEVELWEFAELNIQGKWYELNRESTHPNTISIRCYSLTRSIIEDKEDVPGVLYCNRASERSGPEDNRGVPTNWNKALSGFQPGTALNLSLESAILNRSEASENLLMDESQSANNE